MNSKRLHCLPCPLLLRSIINIVLCIFWLPGAAAVPDVQGPLTLLQCNLAGNARTLLTLLLLANSLHYSYPLNRIWFHIFAQSKKKKEEEEENSPVYNIQDTWMGFSWIWLSCAETRCYLWQRSPSVWARRCIIRHCHYFYLNHFQRALTSRRGRARERERERERAGHIHNLTDAICGLKWQQQSPHT